MFKDGGDLPDTFDDWLGTARRVHDTLTGDGLGVEKAYIDPVAFPEWCGAHGMEMDAQARMAFATECAARKCRADVSHRPAVNPDEGRS
jgi:hypothetical protein